MTLTYNCDSPYDIRIATRPCGHTKNTTRMPIFLTFTWLGGLVAYVLINLIPSKIKPKFSESKSKVMPPR